jgi:hypothetical protein
LTYEKIFAYLQDDVTRKRPTVELLLNLLCCSAEEKLERRAQFHPSAALVHNGLIHIAPDPNQSDAPFLAQTVQIDEQVARMLLGQTGVDPRLSSFSELTAPLSERTAMPFDADLVRVLRRLATHHVEQTLRVYFQGRAEAEKRNVAEGLAASLGTRLLHAYANRLLDKADYEDLWRLLLREARMHDAVLYISGIDELAGSEGKARRQILLEHLKKHDGIVILAGLRQWQAYGFDGLALMPVVFEVPEYRTRAALWKRALEDLGQEANEDATNTLAARFKLDAAQITQAASSAALSAQWRMAGGLPDGTSNEQPRVTAPSLEELTAAARSQCGHELAHLTRKIEPKYKWDDIVLPPDQMAQLKEMCLHAEHRQTVYNEWGFDGKLSLGKGLNVLFCGPPGTGKTMAAEVVARGLQLDLYRIDLSQVVSKYIGETEKTLNQIFAAAEDSNGILFFDEADALFGKRSEVRDSHDRYANIEISYLLQKMEEYEGMSILATNLRQNLDDAFIRRLQFIVEFPFPDEEFRRRIWENVFPKETPLADDVRFDLLAREVRLAGGNIKNMALAAAFYAASAHECVRMGHLIQAAYREHQKLGKSWSSHDERMAKAALH